MNGSQTDVPLCIDMDGTLVRSDTLIEATALFIKQHFFVSLMIPFWILRGRAHYKNEIARRTKLDVKYLPYEARVIEAAKNARKNGRRVVLCTGANRHFAVAVADHLGLFDEVIASDARTNLSGANKQRALVEHFGANGYDYIGNDLMDLPAFETARKSLLVSPTRALRRRQASLPDSEVLVSAERASAGAYLSQLRIHQWLKNVLIFVALLASQRYNDVSAILAVLIGFVSFGLCASSVYVLNDLMDLPHDRRHPNKRSRPFASGRIPANYGMLFIPSLALIAFSLATLLPLAFLLVLILYYFVSLNYNLWAKNIAVLDTLFLAGLYTLRVIAGAAAISVVPSFWLMAFSMFFFLSIAMAKRYSELVNLDLKSDKKIPGRQYRMVDLNTIISQGAASGYASVLVLALYINSDEVVKNYSHPQVIWLTCPLLLYWINKLWLNAQRREMHDDPLVWAIENRVSRGIAIIFTLLLVIAI